MELLKAIKDGKVYEIGAVTSNFGISFAKEGRLERDYLIAEIIDKEEFVKLWREEFFFSDTVLTISDDKGQYLASKKLEGQELSDLFTLLSFLFALK